MPLSRTSPWGAARARNPTSHISTTSTAFRLPNRIPDHLMATARRHAPENRTQITTSTISLTIRLRRASWNAMNPRIQCVLTQ